MVCADLSQNLRRLPRVLLDAPDTLQLDRSEMHHLKVRRADSEVLALNGKGYVWHATVAPDGAVTLLSRVTAPPVSDRKLVAALTAKTAIKDLIKYATMNGVRKILLFASDHSASHGNRYGPRDLEKMQNWAAETVKQSLSLWVPEIEIADNSAMMQQMSAEPHNYLVLDPGGVEQTEWCDEVLVIGPEGGWSQAELDFFRASEIRILRLPMPVLTAPAAALAALSIQADRQHGSSR